MLKFYWNKEKKNENGVKLFAKQTSLRKKNLYCNCQSLILLVFKILNLIYPTLFLSHFLLNCFLFICDDEKLPKDNTMSNEDFKKLLLEHAARGAAKETIFFITGLVTAGVLGKNFWNGHETLLQLILQNPSWVFCIYFIGMLSSIIYYNNWINVDIELFPQLKKVPTEVPDGPTLLRAIKRLIEESEKN